jgi:hypothetical protein
MPCYSIKPIKSTSNNCEDLLLNGIDEDELSNAKSVATSAQATKVFKEAPAKPAASKSNTSKAKAAADPIETKKSQRLIGQPQKNYKQPSLNEMIANAAAEANAIAESKSPKTKTSKPTPAPVKKGPGRGKLSDKVKEDRAQAKEEKRQQTIANGAALMNKLQMDKALDDKKKLEEENKKLLELLAAQEKGPSIKIERTEHTVPQVFIITFMTLIY